MDIAEIIELPVVFPLGDGSEDIAVLHDDMYYLVDFAVDATSLTGQNSFLFPHIQAIAVDDAGPADSNEPPARSARHPDDGI